MFYNMTALELNKVTGTGSLGILMSLGTIVTGIFSSIFIFYTNSFLVKRRKKEFGLYNVLGMDKNHIGKVMICENTMIGFLGITFGILFGILFSKMITLLLYRILKFDPKYHMEMSFEAIFRTVILFGLIFIATLISTIVQVQKSKPVELLKGGQVGEKEPKSNWFLTILGVVSLGGGYYIALTVKNPIQAVTLFFLAVVFVMIGTYCLFTAGSVVLLKTLRKHKGYYYKTNHFVSLSSMIYRMKKNAVGLSNICIMSTAVLIMISTTVSMYVGMEDLMNTRFPVDADITFEYTDQNRPEPSILDERIQTLLQEDQMKISDFMGFESLYFVVEREGNVFRSSQLSDALNIEDITFVYVIPCDDYNRISGESVQIDKNEVVLISENDPNEVEKIQVLGKDFQVTGQRENIPLSSFQEDWVDMVYLVVDSTNTVDELYRLQQTSGNIISAITYDITFDFNDTDEVVLAYCKERFISHLYETMGYEFSYRIKQMNIEEFYVLYGGLFFLGIFLGFLFLIATVLIIYYKQVVEGYEDRDRFQIMQNVGMSKSEVKKSINSQVLTVFFLPILAAGIHIVFAFPILTKLLAMLSLENQTLFLIVMFVTIVVFAVFYAFVYYATSKVYYAIVEGTSSKH